MNAGLVIGAYVAGALSTLGVITLGILAAGVAKQRRDARHREQLAQAAGRPNVGLRGVPNSPPLQAQEMAPDPPPPPRNTRRGRR